MEYTDFGKTGMKVSKLCFGTWGIGGAGWDANTDETKIETIRAAFDAGINFFDTAPAYNGGAAEKLIGRAFEGKIKRNSVYISTKCATDYINGEYIKDGSRENILRECDESLKNLKTDYIDLYFVHWPDPNVSLEETVSTVAELKKAGKILHIGVSNFTPEQLEEAVNYADIEAVQLHHSMLERDQQDRFEQAVSKGMGTMAYGPLGGGILTGRFRELTKFDESDNRGGFYQYFKEPGFSKAMKLLAVIDEIAAAHDATPSEVTLNWEMAQPFVTTTIFGTQKKERLLANCKCFDWKISDEEIAKINKAIAEHLA